MQLYIYLDPLIGHQTTLHFPFTDETFQARKGQMSKAQIWQGWSKTGTMLQLSRGKQSLEIKACVQDSHLTHCK